jgi:DNA polymerase-3 subunit beta
MQISIERDPLIQALGQLMGAVETKNTIPVLSNVLLRTADRALTLTGTNLNVEVETTIDAYVAKDGQITVPARDLLDIARKSPPGAAIELALDQAKDNRMKVKAGRSNYALPTLPASDFPTMTGVQDGHVFTLTGDELGFLIDRTRHATSDEATRYYLCGAYLHTVETDDGLMLRMTSTDVHRLAVAEMAAPIAAEGVKAVIPNKTLDLARQIADGVDQVTISASATKFRVDAGETILTSKVIEGTYVDYARAMPKLPNPKVARLKASDLARGIDQACIMARDKERSLRFTFTHSGLNLSTHNDLGGHADTTVEAAFDCSDFSMGFNSKYVQDVMSLNGDADLVCEMWEPDAQLRITNPSDPGVTYIVMPCRI